jgi:hypothetical protein
MRKTTIAVAIATTLAVSALSVSANETSTTPTGTIQQIVDGQVVKTIHTYGIGEMPSTYSPVRHVDGIVPEVYNQFDAKGLAKIDLDEGHFLSKKVGDKTTLSLIGEEVEYTTESVATDANGVVTWIGNTVDGDGAIISMGKDGVAYGSVYSDEDTYAIETQGEKDVWLVSQQKSGVKMPTVKGDTEVAHNHALDALVYVGTSGNGVKVYKDTVTGKTTYVYPNSNPSTPSDASITIDLLYAYSTSYKSKIDTYMASLTPGITKAFKDSGMPNVAFRTVGKIEVPYADTEPTSGVPSKMQQGLGIWKTVKDMRARVGADLVIFVRPFKQSQVICGQALLNGANDTAFNSNVANAVVGAGSDGAYGCYGDTMVHEVGHIMGVVHNKETMEEFGQGSVKGVYNDSYGYALNYTYGKGGESCAAGDVMSYCFSRKLKYSGPDVVGYTYANGSVLYLGVRDVADATRTLKITAPKIANFMASKVQ